MDDASALASGRHRPAPHAVVRALLHARSTPRRCRISRRCRLRGREPSDSHIPPDPSTALVIAPAHASAASSACGVDLGPYAPASQDQTTVSIPAGRRAPRRARSTSRSRAPTSTPSSTRSTAATRSSSTPPPARPRSSARASTASRTASRDGSTGTWTDWVDEFVRIDSGDPVNTTPSISSNWRKGPAFFPRHGHRRDLPGAHRVARRRRLLEPEQHRDRRRHRHAHARHRGRRRRRQRKRVTFTVNIDNDAPTDTTDTRRSAGSRRRSTSSRRHRRGLRRRPRRVADRRADRPARARTARSSRSARRASTSSAPASSTRSATSPRGAPRTCGSTSHGPIDTTAVADDLVHDPDGRRRHHRHRQPQSRPRAHRVAPGRPARRRRLQPGQQHGPGDDHRRRRAPARGAHDRRRQPRPGLAHAPGQDRHRHPDRPHDGRVRLAPVLLAERQRARHRRALRRSSASSGGSTAARRAAPRATTTTSPSPATASTRSRPASSTTPAGQRLGAAHDQARRAAPTNLTPVAPTGWRNTPYSVTLDGADALSGVASVSWKLQLEGQRRERATRGSPAHRDRPRSTQDGTHTLSTRVRDIAGNYSAWRTEIIRIDRVLPTDDTSYPARRSATATSSPSTRRTTAPASPAVEWKLDGGAARPTRRRRSPARATTRSSVRVQDNAGNWSAWVDHTITVVLPPDTTAPTDNTSIPRSGGRARTP